MSSTTSPNPSPVDDPSEAVVTYLFERVYSKGECHRIDDVIASDAIGYSPDARQPTVGPGGFRSHVVRLRTAFDGFTVEIENLRVRGDTFRVAWTATGTHERRFHGVEPTCNVGRVGEEPHGNRIRIAGETSGTVRNGRIETITTTWDATELRRQLGASIDAPDAVPDAAGSMRRASIPDGAPAMGRPTDHVAGGG